MANKVFFDLNIIIDVLDSTRPRHEPSKSVLKKAVETDCEIVISSDMLTNFFYICQKKFNCHKMTNALSFIMTNFIVLDFSGNIIESSMRTYEEMCNNGKNADFEDLLQLICAKQNGCLVFVTEDKEIKENGVFDKVLNSEEFLSYVHP